MTGVRRIWEIIGGLAFAATGAAVILFPDHGLQVAVAVLSITMTLRGIGVLLYYLSMARHMVGGRRTLYRGMLLLDFGVLTLTVSNYSSAIIIMYLAGLHAFSGAVDLLNGREAKRLGSPAWRARAATGYANIFIAALVIICGFLLGRTQIVVYIYAAGLIYSGLVRAAAAFRRTAIVYIQ